MEQVMPPEEWAEIYNLTVCDPDGWRSSFTLEGVRYHAQQWDIPVSRKEWEARVAISSIIGKRNEATEGSGANR